jgi:hypothetical protein
MGLGQMCLPLALRLRLVNVVTPDVSIRCELLNEETEEEGRERC